MTRVARKADANSDEKPTADTRKAPKAGSIIETASDSIASGARDPSSHQTIIR